MNTTPDGYIDLTCPDVLLEVALENFGAIDVPDQRDVTGVQPQPGVQCFKCGHRDDRAEAYGSGNGSFVVVKTTCDLVVRQAAREPYRIHPTILNYLVYENEWEEEHVQHVAGVVTPGIVIFMVGRQANGDPGLMCHLVDGTHRAVAALRSGRNFFAYVLVPDEALRCTSYLHGAPNPHFIGQRSDALFDGRNIVPLR